MIGDGRDCGSHGKRDGGSRGKRDDSSVELQDSRNGPKNNVNYPLARGVHLICEERKHDSAGTLHPCNFNPMSFDPKCHSVGQSHPPKTAFSSTIFLYTPVQYCLASLGSILNRYRHSAAKVRYANRDRAMLCDDIS